MSYTFNYKMLSFAREIRGISQKELADSVDVLNQGNLSRIERGLLKASENVILQVAKVLSFPPSFFEQNELKSTLNEIYYRKRKTTLKGQIKKFEAKRDLIVKVVDGLMEGIEMPECKIPLIDLSDGFSPITAARKIREYLKIPNGPIQNLVNIIEREGIIVQLIDAPGKIEGCTMISDTGFPIIFLNKNNPPDKLRFTLAHELGHIVMHLYFLIPETRKVEEEVNQFASEFLMPERDSSFDLSGLTFSKLPTLKAYWGTSYATIIRRAYDLGKISKQKQKSMYIQRSQLGYIKSEPSCGLKMQKPGLLKHICNFYINNLEYSKSQLFSSLHLYEEDFEIFVLNKKPNHQLKILHNGRKKPQINLNDLR